MSESLSRLTQATLFNRVTTTFVAFVFFVARSTSKGAESWTVMS